MKILSKIEVGTEKISVLLVRTFAIILYNLSFRQSYWIFIKHLGLVIKSPTVGQLLAARRDLSEKSLRNHKKLFDVFGIDKGTILDVGGNLGYTSILYRSVLPASVRVITFEPYRPNFKYIVRNISKFDIHFIPLAISDKREIIRLSFPTYSKKFFGDKKQNTGRVSAVGLSDGLDFESREAFSVCLDDLFKTAIEAGTIKFIKIDVEGFELKVLLGSASIMTNDRPLIQVEANPITMKNGGFTMNDIASLCIQRGYDIFTDNKNLGLIDKETGLVSGTCEVFLVPQEDSQKMLTLGLAMCL